VIVAFFCFLNLQAQETSDVILQSLINAERKFIKQAKEENTRDAFIANLADDALTFDKDIHIGTDYLKAQTPNEGWLFWDPIYSDISKSGDLGFNTGPWEYRVKRSDEKAVAFGQFVTVWKKVNGEWKAAIDIGISHDVPKLIEQWKTSTVLLKDTKTKTGDYKQELLDVEKKFIASLAVKHNDAYADVISTDARFYRGGSEPKISPSEIQDFLKISKNPVTFTPVDGTISAAGDMGFVYGRTLAKIEKDGVAKEHPSFYMRIWKKENGKWKIALDIIS
jgi:ketosteroid isomerase-like protein